MEFDPFVGAVCGRAAPGYFADGDIAADDTAARLGLFGIAVIGLNYSKQNYWNTYCNCQPEKSSLHGDVVSKFKREGHTK